MATTSASHNVRRSNQERMSLLAVSIMTLVALLIGAFLKASVENQSQHFERKGVTASLPANWTVEDGAGSLIFVSWDPFVPNVRYSVSIESNDGNHGLDAVAAQRNFILGKVLEAFRVLDETPVIRHNREGYKVTYAFVDTKVSGLPLVLQGVDYYFPEEGKAIVISLQARERDYDEALKQFESFLDSVSFKPGD